MLNQPKKSHPFTLHIRLTKACNANCTYCSSFTNNPDRYMSLEDFKTSLNFFWDIFKKNSIKINKLTLEYVGGEIMLVPYDVLVSQVLFAREFFFERGVDLSDGAQTNLIGSKKKVNQLYDLFDGRISTSIDSFSDQRRVGNSSHKYKLIMSQREDDLFEEKSQRNIPAVFTIDKTTLPMTMKELNLARRNKRNIMIRPVFNGGSDISSITPDELGKIMCETFDAWALKSQNILEPHLSLLKKRIQSKLDLDKNFNMSYCSFQSDCAKKSMSIEPNGDLYTCQELADAQTYRLGNALKQEWDQQLWSVLNGRPENLHEDCLSCPYFKDCQGGCMMHATQDGVGPYGKPSYCTAWKMIFKKIDEKIDENKEQVIKWIDKIK